MGNVQVGDKEEEAFAKHEAIILSMTKEERRVPRIIGGSAEKESPQDQVFKSVMLTNSSNSSHKCKNDEENGGGK